MLSPEQQNCQLTLQRLAAAVADHSGPMQRKGLVKPRGRMDRSSCRTAEMSAVASQRAINSKHVDTHSPSSSHALTQHIGQADRHRQAMTPGAEVRCKLPFQRGPRPGSLLTGGLEGWTPGPLRCLRRLVMLPRGALLQDRCSCCNSATVLALKNAAGASNSTVAQWCCAVQRSILR